jgi:Family of unknown function (DUF6491)
MRKFLSILAASFAMAACVGGQSKLVFQAPAGDAPEAQIRFVQYGNVNSWHAETDRLLYIQGRNRAWYQVVLFAPCDGLEFSNDIRLIPSDGAGTFDRFGYVALRGNLCKVESVKSIAPPLRTTRTPVTNSL